jgi:hypothetical protein
VGKSVTIMRRQIEACSRLTVFASVRTTNITIRPHRGTWYTRRSVKVRVVFEDHSQREFAITDGWGSQVSIANDAQGSLSIVQVKQEISRVMPQGMSIESRLLAIIRRNEANSPWREVELVEADEPQIMEFGQPKLAVN